ncbi:MAG TPA: carbon-nitrogen hydrolase family protein [Firmicutes bacterium]|nr:carbon-nitrogen hydrolase family protein [Bacillota bacterium]
MHEYKSRARAFGFSTRAPRAFIEIRTKHGFVSKLGALSEVGDAMEEIGVAVAQVGVTDDPCYNAEVVGAAIKEARTVLPQCNLVVFPELVSSGYFCGNRLPGVATRPGSGPVGMAVCEAARSENVYVAYGYAEQGDLPGVFYDSAVLISPAGRVIANYRKVHVLPREAQYFASGDRLALVETELGPIGLLVCWDVAFPEPARAYAMAGAHLLVVLAAWENPYGPEWELAVRARALDNGLYVAGCNRFGVEGDTMFAGGSLVCDPLGRVLAEAPADAPHVATAVLNANRLVKARLEFATQIRELRPDAYGRLQRLSEEGSDRAWKAD